MSIIFKVMLIVWLVATCLGFVIRWFCKKFAIEIYCDVRSYTVTLAIMIGGWLFALVGAFVTTIIWICTL